MRYVTYLRAINVGGHTVKMDTLKSIFTEAGFTNVAHLLASGNIIFESQVRSTAKLETAIEKMLNEALPFPNTAFVRSLEENAGVIQRSPFSKLKVEKPQEIYVCFLKSPLTPEQKKMAISLGTETDEIIPTEREIYWFAKRKVSEGTLTNASFEKALKCQTTVRNMETVKKVSAPTPISN